MNLLEYIEQNKNISFEEKRINEIDSLIFTILSYEKFDEILDEAKTIKEVCEIFFNKYREEELRERISLTSRSFEVLKAMGNTFRYKNLILDHYINEIDEQANLQFSAITIQYRNKWKYVAFRGTDDTIVGWKEDFMMCCNDTVLSQQKAVDYLNGIFDQDSFFRRFLKKCDVYIGGHSKGGNLAMYASANCKSGIQKNIVRVDNFDGPGFIGKVWDQANYAKITSKLTSYIPTSSIFGRLFEHDGEVQVIHSDGIGLFQHDAFSWHIEGDHFVEENELSEGSNKAITILNELLLEFDIERRKELIESTFQIITNMGIHTFNDVKKLDIGKIFHGLLELKDLDKDAKRVLFAILRVMWDVSEIRLERILEKFE